MTCRNLFQLTRFYYAVQNELLEEIPLVMWVYSSSVHKLSLSYVEKLLYIFKVLYSCMEEIVQFSKTFN